MIIPLFREISRLTDEGISFAIICPRSEEDLEVILGDFLSPSISAEIRVCVMTSLNS